MWSSDACSHCLGCPRRVPTAGSVERGEAMTRDRWFRLMLGGLIGSFLLMSSIPPHLRAQVPLSAFSRSSYWNTPLPKNAPVDPASRAILRFLRRHSAGNFIRLGGTDPTGEWGMPIYSARDGDPVYDVANNCSLRMPPEFDHVRIPAGAAADPTSDAAMTVYDEGLGYVFAFWHARFDADGDTWSSCGGTVYYLGSNGLDGKLRRSDEPRNTGHRGLPPPTWAVRLDEIEAGSIDHVLKIAVPATKCRHVFPMVADECGTRAAHAPPEGTRIRIKPGVDLARFHLSSAALVVARALKRYGAIIGDQTRGKINLKVENTVAEGEGWGWRGVLGHRSLSNIPLRSFQVIRLGYRG